MFTNLSSFRCVTSYQGMSDLDNHSVLPGQRVGVHEPTLVESKMATKLLLHVDKVVIVQCSVPEKIRSKFGLIFFNRFKFSNPQGLRHPFVFPDIF